MTAVCFDSLNSWSLLLGRVSILFVGAVSFALVVAMLKAQPDDKRDRAVPRVVFLFALFWLGALLSVTVWIMTAGCDKTLSPLKRTLFASALTWSLFGMTWVAYYGMKWRQAVRATQDQAAKVAEIMKTLADKEGGL